MQIKVAERQKITVILGSMSHITVDLAVTEVTAAVQIYLPQIQNVFHPLYCRFYL